MSKPIPEEKLAEWEALERAAAPGPWEVEPCNRCDALHMDRHVQPGPCPLTRRDAGMPELAFMSASRDAMPALITEVRRLREIAKAAALEAARRLEATYDRAMAERAEERKAAKP